MNLFNWSTVDFTGMLGRVIKYHRSRESHFTDFVAAIYLLDSETLMNLIGLSHEVKFASTISFDYSFDY